MRKCTLRAPKMQSGAATAAIGSSRLLIICALASVVRGSQESEVSGGDREVPVLDVYRMIQYDQNEMRFGSRRSGINM